MGDRAIDCEDYIQNCVLHVDSTPEDNCSICFEPSTQENQRLITTQCSHPGVLYHEQCLLQWFRPDHANSECENNSCPVCRKALWKSDQEEDDMHDEDTEENELYNNQISFGLIRANDPTYDLPRLNAVGLWGPTIGDTVGDIVREAGRGLMKIFGEQMNAAVITRFTGIDMNNANELKRLSNAARMMHYYAILHAPTHLPELVHLIRRGILTSRLMDFWSENVEPADWSALLADLRACRTEVCGLDYNTVSFLEGLPHTAEEVWDYATQPTLMYSTDIPVLKGSSIMTTFYKDDSRFSVIKKVEYTLREGSNSMAGYSSKVSVDICVRDWDAKFVLELEDLDAILGFTISHETREINIRLVDGCRIELCY